MEYTVYIKYPVSTLPVYTIVLILSSLKPGLKFLRKLTVCILSGERYSFDQDHASPYEPDTNKILLRKKKIKALLVSAEPAIITGIISLF